MVSDDGLQSTLHLNCATLEDNCEFIAEVDDLEYGFTTSSCLVSVKGTLNCIQIIILQLFYCEFPLSEPHASFVGKL